MSCTPGSSWPETLLDAGPVRVPRLDRPGRARPVRASRPGRPVPATVWWTAFRALDAGRGETGGRTRKLSAGRDWIEQTAQEHVPSEFRDSFLENNALNRKLLTAARARLE